ncbi:MAG: thioredoxin [Lentisphaeria bacterium]|nr:thioredoxin [Lentisphaeria bacterium]MBQ9774993.1 thioredoxin [Lentisphaeria bacterium]
MEVLHLNKESFEKLTAQTEKPVLIDFWAEWCGPCQMLGPQLEELAAEHDEIIVGKVNVEEYGELAAEMGVSSIPAMFFFRNGKLEQSLVGFMDKKSLAAKLGL